jgi:hypothetical protein
VLIRGAGLSVLLEADITNTGELLAVALHGGTAFYCGPAFFMKAGRLLDADSVFAKFGLTLVGLGATVIIFLKPAGPGVLVADKKVVAHAILVGLTGITDLRTSTVGHSDDEAHDSDHQQAHDKPDPPALPKTSFPAVTVSLCGF